MEQNKIDIQGYKDFFADLIGNMEQEFLNSNYQEQFENFKKEYQDISEKNKVYVVVAGDYSTGKSTIISALTGRRDIEIDSDVKTDYLQKYDFGGVCYIDTPGLGSGIKEHTALAHEGIGKADFILYCITVDTLFTESSLQEFLTILNDPENKGRVILCVNKLGSDGIDKKNRGKYLTEMQNDLEDIILQNIKDKRNAECQICIFSAKRYIEGCDKNIEGMINESYFENLIDEINEITREFNVSTEKCMKQKNAISSFLQKVLNDVECQKSPDQKEKENQEKKDLIKRIQSTQNEAIGQVKEIFYEIEQNLISTVKEKISTENYIFSSEKFESLKKTEIQKGINKTQKQVMALYQKISAEYEDIVLQENQELDEKMFWEAPGNRGNGKKFDFTGITNVMDNFSKKIINEWGKPVEIGKRRVGLFRKEVVYSKTGGVGTELYMNLTKHFGTVGESASYILGEAAEKIAKNMRVISTVGTLLDLASEVGSYVQDYRNAESRKKICQDCKKDIRRTIDKIIAADIDVICNITNEMCRTVDTRTEHMTIQDDIEVYAKDNLNKLNNFEVKFVNQRG